MRLVSKMSSSSRVKYFPRIGTDDLQWLAHSLMLIGVDTDYTDTNLDDEGISTPSPFDPSVVGDARVPFATADRRNE